MKAIFISTLQPETNYSRFLSESLKKILKKDLIVYTDKNPKNKNIKFTKRVWKHGFSYFFDILNAIKIDKPSVVHLQQEMNMYGKPITTIIFPFLILFIRLLDIKVIVTIHAVVEKKIIDRTFVNSFVKNGFLVPIFLLKIYFDYLFFFIGLFSNEVIVHTHLLKKSLVRDYHVSSKKVVVIPHGVPNLKGSSALGGQKSSNYFLYFGYIARRKGLDNVVLGFSKFADKHPDYKLILAGGIISGQVFAQDELKKVIAKLKNRKQIIFTGFIDQKKITKLFINAKAIVLPAVISMSASGPQALAYGYDKCVIASNIGNFKEEIKDGVNGFLTENNQWDKAFERVVKNKSTVKEIEKNVAKIAIARDWDKIAQKHIEIYEKISE
jgi:glycosyltransferase involved in cell wall biosynthesis